MRNILLTTMLAVILSSFPIKADNQTEENSINLEGQCKAIASSPDGSTYVLMEDKRLVCINPD